MKSARACKERFENIVALVMGELDPAAAEELQVHVADCDTCRANYDALAAEENEVRSGFEAFARNLGPVEELVLDEQRRQSSARISVFNDDLLERVKDMILTHKRLSAAAATATALAACLIVYICLFSSSTAAYAMEQTAQANNHVTSYHAKFTPAAELGEVWVQLNPDGTPFRARIELLSPEDGPKVGIIADGKAEIWFKKKKSCVFVSEKDSLKFIMGMRSIFDPKLAFETIQNAKKAGNAHVETKEPAGKGEPITLTVTYKDNPNRRAICEVDADTKLMERITTYDLRDGQWKQVQIAEFLDYNKEIDPRVFKLDLPKDVYIIDQINQQIGLAKGDLTQDEIAAKVAKEFFEALIAEDYKKAGLLLEGMPADKMKEMFGRFKFKRIVTIGKPVPGPRPEMKAIQVPIKVEADGTNMQFAPLIRPVYGHADRWDICGGI
jgi:hypothetical protein